MGLKQNTWKLNQWYDQSVAGNATYSGENKLYTWGQNEEGELGHNNTTDYSSPKQVGSDTNWGLISRGASPGNFRMSATKTDGTLWAWGGNDYGALGQNQAPGSLGKVSSPIQIGSDTTWPISGVGKILCKEHMAAIKTDGTLWLWGENPYGQLGQGNVVHYSSPVQLGSASNWKNIGAAQFASVAIKTNGEMWAWGSNYKGMLGQNVSGPGSGITGRLSSPVQIPGTTWAAVSKGSVVCALATKTDGTLWMWGDNDTNDGAGILGQNNRTDYSSPVQVGSSTDWPTDADKISINKHAAIAIKTDGTMWSWGSNYHGNLGMDNPNAPAQRSSPIQIPGTTWSTIAAGEQHFIATRTDGSVWTWGINTNGRLGLGNDAAKASPYQLGSASDWGTPIVAGGRRSGMAISSK